MKKAYFVTGIGCSGKSTLSHTIAGMVGVDVPVVGTDLAFVKAIEKLGVTDEHRSKINDIQTWTDPTHIGKESYAPYETFEQCIRECYHEILAVKKNEVVIEGESPALRSNEWNILMEELEGYEVRTFFLSPEYTQWAKNRSRRYYLHLEKPNEFYPPYLSPEQYENKQIEFREHLPKNYFEISDPNQLNVSMTVPGYQFDGFSEPKWPNFQFPADMKGKTFLDIGCNAGWFMRKAAGQGAKVYGVDIDWHLLDITLERVPDAEVSLQSIEKFESGMQFDYILCASAFHFFTDHDNVLAKISSMTREYFILEIPVIESDKEDLVYDPPIRSAVMTRPLIMKWLTNNFKHVEEIGTTDQWQPNDEVKKFRHVFRCSN